MLETIALFFLTWYGIGALFLLSFFLINAASFLSFVLVAASGYLLYAKVGQELSIWLVVVTLIGYFGIGSIWSFFRYKRFLSEKIAEFLKQYGHVSTSHLIYLKPSENKYDIFIWISVWPVSMAENLMTDITDYVMKLFSGVYQRLYDSATKDLPLKYKDN